MPELFAYTDGACSGNPGPGGWGALLIARDGKLASVDALIQLTNSRIESTESRLREYAAEAAEFERSGKPVPAVLPTFRAW